MSYFTFTDEKGLIMGEFGFITADNVYHLTVYATDEDGNFKIISMKNIKLAPTTTTPPPTTPAPFKIKPANKLSCSGCKIPETTTGNPDTTTVPAPFKIASREGEIFS